MNITAIFVQRPVLATVISLLILTLGLRSIFSLPVRQFPEIQSSKITVVTTYFGASADIIAGFITTPIEQAMSQAQGIDYISSQSTSSVSTVTANLRLNYDSNKALTEISAKVNAVKDQLPEDAQDPKITIAADESFVSMVLTFTSDILETNAISDYLSRVVVPRLQTLEGIQSVEIWGERKFALRAWLDPQKMQGYGLTATDVNQALAANNFISALGTSKGQTVQVSLAAATDLKSLDEFRKLIIKQDGASLVRLEDVANVTLGNETYDFNVTFDGKEGVFIAISTAPDANLLSSIKGVREAFPQIKKDMPSGIVGSIVYDATEYVNSSINEVIKTLIEALIIVTIVIFLFLGNIRSVFIPTIAIPLSLIGAFFIMLLLGYSINLLTLLALVLAIGLVVDDAIIVVENVDRHIKEGKKPFDSAMQGVKELANPIISMTIVLIAVYIPVGFQGGITGSLFTEFAFCLAGAVTISGIVALTLSPMLCSKMLSTKEGRFQHLIDQGFEKISSAYENLLTKFVNTWKVVVTFGFLIIILILVMMNMSQSELAPQEDQGFAMSIATANPNISTKHIGIYGEKMNELMASVPENLHTFTVEGIFGANSIFGGLVTTPWDQRERSTQEIVMEIQEKYNEIAGIKVGIFPPPSLPGSGGGLPFQFIVKTTDSYTNLYEISQKIMDQALASKKFYFLDVDLNINKPQVTVEINRDKAAALGLSMRDIGLPLTGMLAGGNVNYFNIEGKAYKVIPQVRSSQRLNPEQLGNYYLRSSTGEMIPASSVISFSTKAIPQSINRVQQLNSVTVSGVIGVSMSEAITTMEDIARDLLPSGYYIDYGGESRQTVQESSSFAYTMMFSILIIFLVLSAQFESFRDSIIIMISVPMAIFGAMIFIFEGLATLNIYTQVGLVTLVGLIAKHGILIVQFANESQKTGKSRYQAIIYAAKTRLRPILMTTAATAIGVIPLVIASGAGAVGRNNMGLVISTGISIGTLFTLFVVPAMYMWLASDHQQKT